MPFFSKLKKAKEAAAEHKKEAATQVETKPKVPYKHVPVHAGIDALAATPSTMGSKELRDKIAAARRSRSVSSASAPAYRSSSSTYHGQAGGSRSRPASIISSTSHSRNGSLGKRTNSDLSISTMMQSHQETPSRGRQPVRTDYLSTQSGVPAVPQLPAQHRPKVQKTMSSRSSAGKRRSPLSAMSITEDHAGEASGEPSSGSEQSDASVASSQSSATEISRPNSSQDHNNDIKDFSKENNYSRPLSTIASATPTPTEVSQTQHKKHKSVIEVTSKPEMTQKKSMKQRLSLFSRKSMVVAAH